MRGLFVVAVLALGLATGPDARGQASGQVLVELVFGLSSPDGGVSEQEWADYVADVLARRCRASRSWTATAAGSRTAG